MHSDLCLFSLWLLQLEKQCPLQCQRLLALSAWSLEALLWPLRCHWIVFLLNLILMIALDFHLCSQHQQKSAFTCTVDTHRCTWKAGGQTPSQQRRVSTTRLMLKMMCMFQFLQYGRSPKHARQ